MIAVAGCDAVSGGSVPVSSSARPPVPSDTIQLAPVPVDNQDPARFAGQVRTHAQAAAVNAQLLMAILYNESDKPHDPALERAWQKMKPDAAFGVANMHKAAFEDTRRGRDFAHRDWQELPDDPDLAIKAAAWYLHDLVAQLPATKPGPYTRDELLALGYNAGAGTMKAFARGSKPGAVAQSYLDRLRQNWAAAKRAVESG
jgi:soluble lytic murein transglycosylase-like protein